MAPTIKEDWRVWMYAILICFGTIQYGFEAGSAGSVLAMSPFKKDFGTYYPAKHSYAVSADILLALNFPSLGTGIIAALISGQICARFGRKAGMFALATAAAASASTLLGSTSVAGIIAGRCVQGLASGFAQHLLVMFLAEISRPSQRGKMVAMNQVISNTGAVIASGVLWATSLYTSRWAYRSGYLLCLIPSFMMYATIPLIPESPRYLMLKGRRAEAAQVLRRLRGPRASAESLEQELASIEAGIVNERRQAENRAPWVDIFRGTDLRRTILIIVFFFFAQYSGTSFMSTYGTLYFQQAGLHNSFMLGWLIFVVSLIGSTCGMIATSYVGRRKILIFGGVVMTVALLTFAIVGVADPGSQAARTCLAVFTLIYKATVEGTWVGVGYAVTSELPSTRLRSQTYGFSIAFKYAFIASLQGWSPYAINAQYGNLGPKMGFIFGPCVAVGTVFIYFFIPETKGRSLEEIDEIFAERIPARKSANYVCKQIAAEVTAKAAALDKKSDFEHMEGEVLPHRAA